jgi:ribose transport system ATP-binding protein
VRWNESATRARTLLTRYGIDAEPRTIAAELSLAQQTMVAIARALQDVQDTDGAVVFLDEPTGALPSHEADALHSWLRNLVAKGHAVVLVTHDIEEALTRCDRVTVLRDGRVLHSGAAADLNRARVIELIAGRSDLDTSRRTRANPEAPTARPALRIDELRGQGIDLGDIAVAPGEIVGITGLLGSGAETVLRSLFGLVPGVSCSLLLDDERYVPTGPRAAMKAGVAYLPGDRLRDGNFVGMSVLENLGKR